MKANTFIQSVLGHTNIKSVTSDEIKLLIQQSQPNLNLNNEMLISKILEEFQKVDKISKNNFKRFINKMCGLSKTTSSPTSVVYWICMGWSDEEGKKKKDLY